MSSNRRVKNRRKTTIDINYQPESPVFDSIASAKLLAEIRDDIDTRTSRRASPLEKFITTYALKQVWTRQRLREFVEVVRPGFEADEISIEFIRQHLIKTMSILAFIGWPSWSQFGRIYYEHRSDGNRDRLDSALPYHSLSDLEGSDFLGKAWAPLFADYQYVFIPITVEEGKHQEYSREYRLPFTNTESQVIGRGGYGEVTRETIARYQLRCDSKLATGDTFLYEHELQVASKTFQTRWGAAREKRVGAELRSSLSLHEHIVPHIATIRVGDEFHILSPLATMDLSDLIYNRHNEMLTLTIYDLMRETSNVAAALSFLHQGLHIPNKVVACCHMDLKPDNILIFRTRTSPVGHWKISDFGISSIKDMRDDYNRRLPESEKLAPTFGDQVRHMTTKTSAKREPGPYQAPEVGPHGEARVGRKSDIWSLGCILYQVLLFGLGGVDLVTEMDMRRRKCDDGITNFENDYFYRKDSGQLIINPHVKAWLTKDLPTFTSLTPTFIENIRRLILAMLSIEESRRPDAKFVRGVLIKLEQQMSARDFEPHRPVDISHSSPLQTLHMPPEAPVEMQRGTSEQLTLLPGSPFRPSITVESSLTGNVTSSDMLPTTLPHGGGSSTQGVDSPKTVQSKTARNSENRNSGHSDLMLVDDIGSESTSDLTTVQGQSPAQNTTSYESVGRSYQRPSPYSPAPIPIQPQSSYLPNTQHNRSPAQATGSLVRSPKQMLPTIDSSAFGPNLGRHSSSTPHQKLKQASHSSQSPDYTNFPIPVEPVSQNKGSGRTQSQGSSPPGTSSSSQDHHSQSTRSSLADEQMPFPAIVSSGTIEGFSLKVPPKNVLGCVFSSTHDKMIFVLAERLLVFSIQPVSGHREIQAPGNCRWASASLTGDFLSAFGHDNSTDDPIFRLFTVGMEEGCLSKPKEITSHSVQKAKFDDAIVSSRGHLVRQYHNEIMFGSISASKFQTQKVRGDQCLKVGFSTDGCWAFAWSSSVGHLHHIQFWNMRIPQEPHYCPHQIVEGERHGKPINTIISFPRSPVCIIWKRHDNIAIQGPDSLKSGSLPREFKIPHLMSIAISPDETAFATIQKVSHTFKPDQFKVTVWTLNGLLLDRQLDSQFLKNRIKNMDTCSLIVDITENSDFIVTVGHPDGVVEPVLSKRH